MKKPQRNLRSRSLPLQAQDLAAVRGGDNGVINSHNAYVGISPQDNGTIHVN